MLMILRFITLLSNSRSKKKTEGVWGVPNDQALTPLRVGVELHTLSIPNSGFFEQPVVNDPVVLKESETFGGRLIVLAPESGLLF